MPDPRFFAVAGPFRLSELAARIGASLVGEDRLVRDVAPLHAAGAEALSFLDNRKYVPAFRASKAGACIVHADLVPQAPEGMALLVSPTPYKSYALAAQAFYPAVVAAAGIHPGAHVDPAAILGEGVSVAAGAVIAARAEIGAGCRIGPNATIDAGVVLGEACEIGANASLSHCVLGARVRIYPGARIGQDGFGFAMGAGGHTRVPQLGRVIIGDDVEVGANATIDRGAGPDTVIGAGTMIDNLVQIGHNVTVGRGCVIVAQAGIAGSASIGEAAVLGGQVGVAGHLKVGARAQVAGQSGVMSDVPEGAVYGGYPAIPRMQWLRQATALARLVKRRSTRDAADE